MAMLVGDGQKSGENWLRPSVCNYRSIEGSHKTKAGFCTGARVSSDTYYIYLNRTAFEGLPAPFRLGHRFSGYNVVFQAEILAIP